jgi:hypothetical protein
VTAHDEAFGQQLVVCQQDDRPRNAELFRQISRGGEAVAGTEGAQQDGSPEPQINLAEDGSALFGKWYHEWHGKWSFKNTTTLGMLIGVGEGSGLSAIGATRSGPERTMTLTREKQL